MFTNKIRSSYFILALLILAGWVIQSAQADYWSVSYYDYDDDYSRSDRISREHREAGDVDDWIERGNSTVTSSPRFSDGIRLSAWASDYVSDDDYDFALASAIYLFDIPRRAQYIEIKVRYSGEGREADFDDYEEIAGRVWIRNFRKEREAQRYDDDDRETLYGDTFVLRAKRRSETIKIPAAYHVSEDGTMELHLVAENGGLLDVEYVDVSTYSNQPEVRVVNRYIRSYEWRPWHYYTYFYFYDGPVYYATDYDYYVRWSYPVYDVHYVTIKKNYRTYVHRYYERYPSRHHGYSHTDINVNVYNRQPVATQTRRLGKWTQEYEQVRREYDRSRLVKTRRVTDSARNTDAPSKDVQRVRDSVRTTIQQHQIQPVLSDRPIENREVRIKRRSSESTFQRSTSERSPVIQDRGTLSQPQQRVRTVRPTEKREDTMEQILRNRTPRSSSTKSDTSKDEREEIKKRRSSNSASSSAPSRSEVKSNRSDSNREEVKKSRSDSSSQSSSSKKDDDDDDDEEEEQKTQQNRENATKRRR
ncbi:hypothetical protein FJZ31_23770 [Candidatus Poribacteria bacterium]|nr:hypothetical protein [Candidatus Poribacteria bacterium]